MAKKRQPKPPRSKDVARRRRHEAEAAAVGAAGGAAFGTLAGPPGAAAGAVIGGVIGALAGKALDADAAEHAARERELDATIGVSGGDLGVSTLEHPPAKIGALSKEASGAHSGAEPVLSEGPILPPPD